MGYNGRRYELAATQDSSIIVTNYLAACLYRLLANVFERWKIDLKNT